jgi:eukaryotic-like serine/threonine-protein kinase
MHQASRSRRATAFDPGATTHTARSPHLRTAKPDHLLTAGQEITSPDTGLRYRVGRLLGQGGFGQVFMATRLGPSNGVPDDVCIKISPHMEGWLREAYFGLLLRDHPRAIQVYDRFPLTAAGGTLLYCLVLECARHGDLSAFLSGTPKAWTESAARREIAGVLEVLRKLHRGQLLHRDLTPMNVFVCEGNRLKLGDFGIVRQQSDRRGVTARTMNLMTAPSEIIDREAPKWQARDDVYQVGQLLGMVVKGDARARLRTADIRGLACGDHLKEIIHRCIGERRKRYDTAEEMIEALKNPPALLKSGVLKSLKGTHLAFTGFLLKPRSEAVRAAERAGAIVHGGPSAKTNVIVRGRPNKLQAAGRDGGLKLMEIKRLREKGHRITLLNETQFWKLVTARSKRSGDDRQENRRSEKTRRQARAGA